MDNQLQNNPMDNDIEDGAFKDGITIERFVSHYLN